MQDPIMVEVAQRFGLGGVQTTEVVARGAMGQVTKLDADDGSWAVKRLFPWANTGNVDAEVELVEAAVVAGIRTPAPCRSDTGGVIETVGEDRYRVWEWAEIARTPEAPAAPDFAHGLGTVAGTIHRLAHAGHAPVSPWLRTRPPSQRWDDLLDAASGNAADWAPRLASALPSIRSLETVADMPIQGMPIRCHNDLGPGNVGVDADDHPVVLDWEHSGSQVARQELGYILVAWCIRDGVVDAPSAAALDAGYNDVAGRPPTDGLAAFAGVACATLNFIAGQANAAMTATDEDQKTFATAAVASYCAHPLSRTSLTELLEVI